MGATDNIPPEKLEAAMRHNYRTAVEGIDQDNRPHEGEFIKTLREQAEADPEFALKLVREYNKASFTPEEMEKALQLQYIKYLANLHRYNDGKPLPDPYVDELRERCKDDSRARRSVIDEYRDGRLKGVSIDDKNKHVRVAAGDRGMDGWLASIGLVNKFEVSREELKQRQQQVRDREQRQQDFRGGLKMRMWDTSFGR